jgi:hypothetical protein
MVEFVALIQSKNKSFGVFMRSVTPRAATLVPIRRLILATSASLLAVVAAGCGFAPAGPVSAAPTPAELTGLVNGRAMGGNTPLQNATVTLFASGTSTSITNGVYQGTATVLGTTTTNSTGFFTFGSVASCTTGTQVYVTIANGNTGAGTNAQELLGSMLGPCGSVAMFAVVNEASTVAMAYALSSFTNVTGSGSGMTVNVTAPSYMNSTAATNNVSSGTVSSASALAHAYANFLNLVNVANGYALSTPVTNSGATSPQSVVNTIASALQVCVNSTGGTGASTNCGKLFAVTPALGGTTATNTYQAALNLARNPYSSSANVTGLFNLLTGIGAAAVYSPTLTAQPNDWTLAIQYPVPNIPVSGAAPFPFAPALDADDNVYVAAMEDNPYTPTATSYHTGNSISACLYGWTSSGAFRPSITPYTGTAGTPGTQGTGTAGSSTWFCAGQQAATTQVTYNLTQIAPDAVGNIWIANTGAYSSTASANQAVVVETTNAGAWEAAYAAPLQYNSGDVKNTTQYPIVGIATDRLNDVWYTGQSSSGSYPELMAFAAGTNGTASTGTPLTIGSTLGQPLFEPAIRQVVLDSTQNVVGSAYGQSSGTLGAVLLGSKLEVVAANGTLGANPANYIATPVTLVLDGGGSSAAANNPGPWGVAVDSSNNYWITAAGIQSNAPETSLQTMGSGIHPGLFEVTNTGASPLTSSNLAAGTSVTSGFTSPKFLEADGNNVLWIHDQTGIVAYSTTASPATGMLSETGGFRPCIAGAATTCTYPDNNYNSMGVAVDSTGSVWYTTPDLTTSNTNANSLVQLIGTAASTWPLLAMGSPGTAGLPTVSITPSSATVNSGSSQGFTATVNFDSSGDGVTWSIGSGSGSLSNVTTTSVTYTAAYPVSTQQTVTLTATSIKNTARSATATITVPATPLTVTVSPTSAGLSAGQTQNFTAAVINDVGSAGVTWSLNPATGYGTLTNTTTTGVTYNAPATIASSTSVTLTATSIANNAKTASVTITLGAISVSLSPSAPNVTEGGTTAFTPTVTNDATNSGVTWTLTAANATDFLYNQTTSGATYYAPACVTAQTTATVKATSVADPTKSATATVTVKLTTAPASQWVYYNASCVLSYKTLTNADNAGANGYDQIMDFSTAGYNEGKGAIPTVTQQVTVSPSGDTTGATDTTAIQNAINTVAAMPLSGGFRGAVVLAAGNYYVNNLISLTTSGVVLRGAGSGTSSGTNTIINLEPMTFATDTVTAWSVSSGTITFTANNSLDEVGETVAIAGFTGANSSLNGTYTALTYTSTQFTASTAHASGSGSGLSGVTAVENMPYPFVVMGPYQSLSPTNLSACSSSYTCYSTGPSFGSSISITDAYIPAGATTIDVASTSGLSVGSTISIMRPITQSWINFMGMNSSTAPIDNCSGGSCNWISAGNTGYRQERTVASINGTQLTLNEPVSDSFDSTYTGAGTVQTYSFSGRVNNVGIENLRVVAPAPYNTLVPPSPTYQLLVSYSVSNAWARNLVAVDTLQTVNIGSYSRQMTISNVSNTHTVAQLDSAEFMDYYIAGGTQILMDTVSDYVDNLYFFSTSSNTQGPNVLRNGSFGCPDNTAQCISIEPHQRWATGLLIEDTTLNGSNYEGLLKLRSRGDYGSGHGWTIGWGVAWNTLAATEIIEAPPGSMNWCIGCTGPSSITTETPPGGTSAAPIGDSDSQGTNVFPYSLYQAQLTARLGAGYVAQ